MDVATGELAQRRDELQELVSSNVLLELVPAAIYVCDRDGYIVRYNRQAAALWGRAPEIGDTEERFCGAHRLFLPDGSPLPHDQTPMAVALQDGVPAHNLEVIIQRQDGSRIWALVNIDPIHGSSGEVIGAINCFQDITGHKQMEQDLRRSQDSLQALVGTTPECIKLVGRDGRLLQMNPAGLSMIGAADMESVAGASTYDLIAEEYRQDWREKHERVCDGERMSWEFDIVALNGIRRHMETHAVPFRLPEGETVQLAVTRDVTKRKQDERALHESEARCRGILEALPTGVYTTDREGRITFFNSAAAEMWGRSPELGELWCGSWRIYRPDGSPLPLEDCPMAVALKEGRAVRDVDIIVERSDGTRVPVLPYPTPLRDSSGEMVGAINMLVDISHHKRAAARQQLLIHELNHRVKNSLATVQSIVNLTLRRSPSPEAFQTALVGRLASLSRTHDLLTQNVWEGADLKEVLKGELAAYASDGPVSLAGEEVRLSTRHALGFAMIFHELAANSSKYGALSSAAGGLRISWSVAETERGAELQLQWEEHDGPEVASPEHCGFGSVLLERVVTFELGGSMEVAFPPQGFRCEISAPIERLS